MVRGIVCTHLPVEAEKLLAEIVAQDQGWQILPKILLPRSEPACLF